MRGKRDPIRSFVIDDGEEEQQTTLRKRKGSREPIKDFTIPDVEIEEPKKPKSFDRPDVFIPNPVYAPISPRHPELLTQNMPRNFKDDEPTNGNVLDAGGISKKPIMS